MSPKSESEKRRLAEDIDNGYRERLRETIVALEAYGLERDREVERLREALARILADPSRAAGIAWDVLHHAG